MDHQRQESRTQDNYSKARTYCFTLPFILWQGFRPWAEVQRRIHPAFVFWRLILQNARQQRAQEKVETASGNMQRKKEEDTI